MNFVLEANGLGKRYRRRWALRDCNLEIPAGHVVGLVGPNGAGKTTLLQTAVGLRRPTTGTIQVLGARPSDSAAQLERIGFVAQDTPTYAGLSVEKHLRMGRLMNPSWDAEFADDRINQIGLDLRQKTGSLSGGERAQLALTIAMAKRPELLLLDEPIASLDPLARRDFLKSLMEFVAAQEVSVVLSSHIVGDLERICDYLVILVASEVRLSGEVSSILGSHRRISGPRRDASSLPSDQEVIEESHTEKQSTFLVRAAGPILDPAFTVTPLSLDDLVVAYMSAARAPRTGHQSPVRKSQMAVVR
jgi:ABC-2 type transport system ATP-binding protein